MISPAAAGEYRRMAESGVLKGHMSVRWTMVFLMLGSIALHYCVRVNLSVSAEAMSKELGWTEKEKGYMLSIFYVGYSIGQIPFVLIAQQSPKMVLGIGMLISGILTLFQPIACRRDYYLGLLLRGLVGLVTSSIFPSIFTFFSRWVPRDEKSLMIATTMSGMYVGEVIGFSGSGILCAKDLEFAGLSVGRWPGTFYVFGVLTLLYVPIWVSYAWNSPEECPYITPEELELLQDELPSTDHAAVANSMTDDEDLVGGRLHRRARGANDDIGMSGMDRASASSSQKVARVDTSIALADVPWALYFSNPVALTCIINAWNFGWINFMMLSEMPAYLSNELGFDLESSAILSVVPYIAMFVTVVTFAAIVECLQFRYDWSTRAVRHCAMLVAFGGSSSFLLLASYTDDVYRAFTYVSLSQASLGAIQSGLSCSYIEITPNFAPILNAVCNTFTGLGGFISPIFVAFMLESFGDHAWHMVFLYTVLQSAVALALWVTFFRGEVIKELDQPWEKSKESKNARSHRSEIQPLSPGASGSTKTA